MGIRISEVICNHHANAKSFRLQRETGKEDNKKHPRLDNFQIKSILLLCNSDCNN